MLECAIHTLSINGDAACLHESFTKCELNVDFFLFRVSRFSCALFVRVTFINLLAKSVSFELNTGAKRHACSIFHCQMFKIEIQSPFSQIPFFSAKEKRNQQKFVVQLFSVSL